ncbi:MAG: ATP synthase subunit C [Ruminococcus sp.]|jgi:V/A-type H+-transporting ATPase subunit K|nr:ATP synthase subunit C [Ruminococcus sp.]
MFFILFIFLLPLIAVGLLALPVIIRMRKYGAGKKVRNALLGNISTFFGLLIICVCLPMAVGAAEPESAADTAATATASAAGMAYIGAALAVGLGSIGCGIAVGGAAPAAIGAVSEEPKAFSKALIFVALGEGVAIYGLLIAFLLINSVG